ncbi:MAG TPA: hypothetical protein PKK10_14805 [Woeseiaceae bacterium]|nr:hypothetical protein [Woeseiaceae bacterium]
MSQSGDNFDDGAAGAAQKVPHPGTQIAIRLSLAIVASVVSFFLAWPWWRDFSYWAESRAMWVVYFAVGFVLAIYVFYAFFGSVRTLFEHDAIERAELAEQDDAQDAEHQR